MSICSICYNTVNNCTKIDGIALKEDFDFFFFFKMYIYRLMIGYQNEASAKLKHR